MYLDYDDRQFGTIPLLLAGILSAGIIYTLGTAIYNVTLHPLAKAKYPGPKLWAAFWFPDTLSLVGGRRAQRIAALHRKYGPVVRINPDALSYIDGRAWKDAYGFRPGKPQLAKDPKFYVNDTGLPAHILSSDDVNHRRYRRTLAHAFSDQALRGQETILNIYFKLLIEKLNQYVDGPQKGKVDMMSIYNQTTFDIIGDLAFGEPFNALEAGKFHPWIDNVFKSMKALRWQRVSGRYPLFRKLYRALQTVFPNVHQSRRIHYSYTAQKVGARLDTTADRKDFISYITKHNDEKGMTRDEMIANAALLIVAGSETTATLLSGATYLLLQNPDKLARLQEEVRTAFSSLDEINLVSSAQLPYLHAVIEESLRMYPPVADGLPRVTPPEGTDIAGQWVPGGTSVAFSHWSAYRDPENFVEPESFAPERFLADAPAKFHHDNKEVFQPFHTGPRNCLGKNLAYNEMRSLLARVIFNYDMELCPESDNWLDQKTFVIWEKGALMVQLTHRTATA